ncbi:MAG: UvrD-helicase domain-containing protein [Lachnospiraceae bacterium]|nr:UvrD-helicase domain-containing protein [Lachnospiraceae bacterium]
MSSIYESLNDRQKEAVFYTEGPLLILAGAGSGKTRVLTHRIAYLIAEKKVEPWNICAITFTNKAAGEMRQRVDSLVGYGSESIWVATFHSSCARILRRFADRLGYDNNFTIYDSDDSKTVMKEVCKKLQIDTARLKEKAILNAISTAKNELINEKEYADRAYDFMEQKISAAYTEYQNLLRKRNAMDFDDLIMNTVELFESQPDVLRDYQNRFRYVCVDEYQDTNSAQFRLVELMSGGYRNLCVVGDDDQSIYKFRGANIRNILDFEKVFPEAKVVRLEQNYRSTQNILDAANSVIANNKGRKKKSLWTDAGAGEPLHFREFDTGKQEAEYIADQVGRSVRRGKQNFSDHAVLYRTNAQSRLLEERFVMEGIPYQIVGGINFYARKEIKDLLSYLKTIDNSRDDLAVKRILNVPKRGIGATSQGKIDAYATSKGISFLDALMEADKIPGLGKAAEKVNNFALMIRAFRTKTQVYDLSDLLSDIIETINYDAYLLDECDDKEDYDNRQENIGELFSKLQAFMDEHEDATLSSFLEEVALVADIDSVEEGADRVLLMTVHGAKGLEFTNVYLAGMEDGVFPGFMSTSSGDPEDIEEERRLCYVAITRAKEELTICCARGRMIHGQTQFNPVSRFVMEIPTSLMDQAPGGYMSGGDHSSRDNGYGTGMYGGRSAGGGYSGSGSTFGQQKPKNNVIKIPYETPGGKGLPNFDPSKQKKKKATPQSVKPFLAVADAASRTQDKKPVLTGLGKNMGVSGASSNQQGTSSRLNYGVGDRVRHQLFGVGTVTAMEPGPRDTKVTVEFDKTGQKIMYAAFAKLVKTEE